VVTGLWYSFSPLNCGCSTLPSIHLTFSGIIPVRREITEEIPITNTHACYEDLVITNEKLSPPQL
jgi:hypothetical protein